MRRPSVRVASGRIETPEGKPYLPASRYLPAKSNPPEIVPTGDASTRRRVQRDAAMRANNFILIDA